MKISSHLLFNGNCEEALNFYQKVLGAKVLMMLRYSEAPADCGSDPEFANKIIHGRIVLGDDVIMGCDAPPGRYTKPGGFSLNVGVATPDEAEKVFAALAEKGTIMMPMAETFWAHRFGMAVDRFDIPWMVNCEKQP